MPNEPEEKPAPDPSLLIVRKRVGTVCHVEEAKSFGFIEAEDYRDNVFFHMSQWDPERPQAAPPKKGMVVEFEIDELHRRESGKLRAKWVRQTDRPAGTKMSSFTDPHLMVKHHPKARQTKPKWRGKKGGDRS